MRDRGHWNLATLLVRRTAFLFLMTQTRFFYLFVGVFFLFSFISFCEGGSGI